MKNPSVNFLNRRHFLKSVVAIGAVYQISPSIIAFAKTREEKIQLNGPGSSYTPVVNAAFVRRKEDYGILWPGAIFDGKKALESYTSDIQNASRELGIKINLRKEPIYSLAEAEEWIESAKKDKVDGLLVVLLDRQQHAWQTASRAADSGIPTVVFTPIGTSFTTNTEPVAAKEGVYISSSMDFSEAKFALKMIKAGARLREMRFIVIRGTKKYDTELPHFGTKLRVVPATDFINEYNRTANSQEVLKLADEYIRLARRIHGATKQDVINGIKSYIVAKNILKKEEGDGITMDCLGALGKTKISLPCIAWSKMNDMGIPAACEADLGACVTHAIVQYLFDRPGFQQDPVPETIRDCLIGAHCSCPTRLSGFDKKPEPFDIMHHHGNRDAVPKTYWKKGERVTIADVILPSSGQQAKTSDQKLPLIYISTGTVVDNVSVPPAGGCVVSIMVKLDTKPDLLKYPGFHQLFFYGDFKKELVGFCKLFKINPVVV